MRVKIRSYRESITPLLISSEEYLFPFGGMVGDIIGLWLGQMEPKKLLSNEVFKREGFFIIDIVTILAILGANLGVGVPIGVEDNFVF